MRTTFFSVGLTILVGVIAGSKGYLEAATNVEHSRRGANGDFSDTGCSSVNPKDKGTVPLGRSATLPSQCGQKSSKRRFIEMLRRGRNLKIDERVVGGSEADPHEYPWLVRVGTKDNGPLLGGAIVSDHFIITGAHAMYDEEFPCNWIVQVGEHDTNVSEPVTVDHEANNIIVHPDFDVETGANNIAIIKLASPVDFGGPSVGPVCLPTSMDSFPAGTTCYLAGWGSLDFPPQTIPSSVHDVDLQLYSDSACNDAYGDDILPGMLCAGYPEGGKDGCAGDTGAPLVCQNGNQWEMVGLFSWGTPCGQPNKPGVYTSINYYMDWIESVIAEYS